MKNGLLKMHERARAARAAFLVRQFEYRQRNHAQGVWFDLRRLLSEAATAWQISADDAARLRSEGISPRPVGFRLSPPLAIHVVSDERLQGLRSRQALKVRLSAELLRAGHLALVPWPGGEG
jgi:hypothetical protein